MTTSELWDALRPFFEDDESLRRVLVDELRFEQIASVFKALCSNADSFEERELYWDHDRAQEMPAAPDPDAAMRAVADRGAAYLFCLRGLTSGGAPVPDVGVSVDARRLTLDFRPGAEWTEASVAAFVSLLSDIRRLAPNARFELDEMPLDQRQRFLSAVEQRLASDAGA